MNDIDILLVLLQTLRERLAEDELVNVTVVDRVGREGAREPWFLDARVEDAAARCPGRHVLQRCASAE